MEAICEVAKVIQAMSDQQAELGRQQAKNSHAILSMSHHALNAIDRWRRVVGTSYICIEKKHDIGTTTLLENRENSQILSFYLFSLASFHQGW